MSAIAPRLPASELRSYNLKWEFNLCKWQSRIECMLQDVWTVVLLQYKIVIEIFAGHRFQKTLNQSRWKKI